MNRAIVVGTLVRDAEQKTAANGKTYTKAMLRVDCKVLREGDPDSVTVWITAFGDIADALALKKKGDAVGAAGRLDLRAALYLEKPVVNASLTCDKLIDATRPPRKPKDDTEKPAPAAKAEAKAGTLPEFAAGSIDSMADDIPF